MGEREGVAVNFVLRHRARDWPDLERLGEGDIEREPARFVGGRNSWIAQSYLRLRERLRALGCAVHVSGRFVPGTICVAHRDDANDFFGGAHRAFVVAVRADRAPVLACDLAIVQNGLSGGERERFVPLWPQPGLRARDPARGFAIRNVAYLGRLGSAPAWFSSSAFRDELARRGVAFEARASGWDDYRDVDVALAARDESARVLATKPATKLYNAWHAGVPLLAMPEPAYLELRRSPYDFIEVRGPGDVVRAVDRLRHLGLLYRDIVANGRSRAHEFGIEAIRSRWIELFEQEILPAFLASRADLASRRLWHLGAMARQKAASRAHRAHVRWERWAAGPHGPGRWMEALRPAFTREFPAPEAAREVSNLLR